MDALFALNPAGVAIFGTSAPIADAVTVTGVSVSPATATGSQTFTATVTGTNSPSQAVTWSASAGAITSGGVFTAPVSTGSAQVITVTAASVQDPSKSGTAVVTIAAVSTVVGVTVTPTAASGPQTFVASVVGTGSPSQAVTWNASAGAITGGGVFTPPVATGLVQLITVTATSVQDQTKFGIAVVTIAAVELPPAVTGVTVFPTNPTLAGAAQQVFSALVEGTGNPSQQVTWSTTIGTISADGVLTTPVATGSQQTGAVTATSVANPAKSGSTAVTVAAVILPILQGVDGPRSKARTLVVSDPQVRQDTSTGVGTFWNLANPVKPKGIKDPNSVIDVSWDWGPWLAEAGDTYASHVIFADNGVVLRATNEEDDIISAFLDRGDIGKTAAITCRIKTNSTPPREEDRTVYLSIKPR